MDSLIPEKTGLSYEEAKAISLTFREGKRWINTCFVPLSTSATYIINFMMEMAGKVMAGHIPLSWQLLVINRKQEDY